ncbi:unnamed protein product [Effrenium voratum]|nr:unnamed protein product [Effrenium voratum]
MASVMPSAQNAVEDMSSSPARLLHEVRAAVVDEAESRIKAKLRQAWTQAAAEVKQHERERAKSMDHLLEEARTLAAAQRSMQEDNQVFLNMLSVWSTHLMLPIPPMPSFEPKELPSGAATPSTCATPSGMRFGLFEHLGLDQSPRSSSATPQRGARDEESDAEVPPSAPPCPLSLADALGIKAPNPEESEPEDAFVFKLTLRVADNVDLGLALSKKGQVLVIDAVLPGAVESWNRQCRTSRGELRALRVGDRLVAVNEASEPEKMLEEAKTRKLLKFQVLRLGGGGKAPAPAPALQQPPQQDDYDPFSEEPAPHVAMEKVFRKAARAAGAVVHDKDPLVKMPPWRRKPPAKAQAPSAPKRKARAPNAHAWLRRNQGGGVEEFAAKPEGPPSKKPKVEVNRGFVKELLDKAPSSLQTCRSLLVFLDKKAEAVPEKPAMGGPEDLRARLEAHAESLGRLDALRATSGWDARAKRVLDISATAASVPGEAALGALQEALTKESQELQKKLKESGQELEEVLKDQRAWAKELLRRDWIIWCGRLLRVQEQKLLGKEPPAETFMTAINILEALGPCGWHHGVRGDDFRAANVAFMSGSVKPEALPLPPGFEEGPDMGSYKAKESKDPWQSGEDPWGGYKANNPNNGWSADGWKADGWKADGWSAGWSEKTPEAPRPKAAPRANGSANGRPERDQRLVGEDSAKVVIEQEDPSAEYLAVTSWDEMKLPKEILDGIFELGFVRPSKIQEWTLPIALKGGNIIGQARNGSGKTAAFALAMLIAVDSRQRQPQGLCLCPTRELAAQNHDVAARQRDEPSHPLPWVTDSHVP